MIWLDNFPSIADRAYRISVIGWLPQFLNSFDHYIDGLSR